MRSLGEWISRVRIADLPRLLRGSTSRSPILGSNFPMVESTEPLGGTPFYESAQGLRKGEYGHMS